MYSIGQLSEKTNISIRTLRYYDEIGLLKPAKVAESGYRYYSNEELRVLQHITALKELGFTLASIKELLSAGKESQEDRWRTYLEFELAAVAEEKKRLDEMERLLQTARYAFEMKGEVEAEDIFLFIKALRSPSEPREAFLAQHFTDHEIKIIKELPDLSANDPRNMEWARLIRKVKEHLHEPPSSSVSQDLAAQIVEVSMAWFQQDEQLIDKYWSLIRPEEGMESKVYGMDADVMNYIDSIVDWYLQNPQEGDGDGSHHGQGDK
ncbi:MerR family transcriptional regulator [Paenibacillus mendelii]|uniref:MerR family transcriptional regulator n=1 Tax=Paenibacillus mendelii TaxID=206163 RepID=A0ABV6JL82_9BACL|nr:MerR family transcriptional regulator [Paenibacillus mendelii]MCQ6562312.1 MerR family transcriptional regulator [Paenibacillus mendelii]